MTFFVVLILILRLAKSEGIRSSSYNMATVQPSALSLMDNSYKGIGSVLLVVFQAKNLEFPTCLLSIELACVPGCASPMTVTPLPSPSPRKPATWISWVWSSSRHHRKQVCQCWPANDSVSKADGARFSYLANPKIFLAEKLIAFTANGKLDVYDPEAKAEVAGQSFPFPVNNVTKQIKFHPRVPTICYS